MQKTPAHSTDAVPDTPTHRGFDSAHGLANRAEAAPLHAAERNAVLVFDFIHDEGAHHRTQTVYGS